MNPRSHIKNFISRGFLFLGYLFFLLVQLNIHFKGVPETISYFSSDYGFARSDHASAAGNQHAIHKGGNSESKKVSCRLNKRFYPEYFSPVPQISCAAPADYFLIKSFLPRCAEPCSDLHFIAYGLRGPPAIV